MKRSLAWMGLGQLGSVILQFTSSIVLARYLSPTEMGLVAVAFAVVSIISLFQQLGLNLLIIREPVLTEELKRSAFTVNVIVTSLLSLTIALVSYAGAAFVHDDRVRHVMLVIAICPMFGIVDFLPAAHLEREGRFKTIAAIGLLANVLGMLTTISFVLNGWSYMSIAFGHVASTGSYAAMSTWAGREHFSCRLGLSAWRRTSEFGFLSLAISGVNNLSQRLSEIALGRIRSLAAVGLYGRANSMNLLIWGNVHSIISRVLLVDFASVHRSGTSLRDRYIGTVNIVTAVLWPAFAGLAITSKSFIVEVYGEKWVGAAWPLVFLSIASIINVSITMTPELFSIKDELRKQTRIEVIRSLVGLVLFFAACTVSLEAAAASRVAEAAIAWALYRPHLNRMTETQFRDFKGVYAGNIALTVIAVAPSAFLVFTAPDARLGLLPLLGSVAAGVVLWGIALVATHHPLGAQVRLLWARRRQSPNLG